MIEKYCVTETNVPVHIMMAHIILLINNNYLGENLNMSNIVKKIFV